MMVEHQRINRGKTEELEESSHKKRAQQQLYDQLKAPDEGIVDFQTESSLEQHSALLANTHSDKQRASLVIQLQQSYGNTYVQHLLNTRAMQAKLTINPPDDEYEREADRVADAVTQTPAAEVQRQEEEEEELMMKPSAEIQRQPIEEEEEELMMKPSAEIQRQPIEEEEEELMMKPTSEIQRQEEEEEEELLQAKPAGSQPAMVSENLETQINDALSGGQPLADSVRTSLEPHFEHDFSQVRLHTDAKAAKISRKLEAEAFTTGKDIFFRDGAYQPDTDSGKRLIAHELTHVVQQQSAPALQRDEVTSTATETQTPTTETTAAAPATAALRALWESMVVGPVQEAHSVLTSGGPVAETAGQASELFRRSIETIRAIKPHYSENEAVYGRLNWVHSRLETINVGLLAYTSERVSMEELIANVEPSSAVVSVITELNGQL